MSHILFTYRIDYIENGEVTDDEFINVRKNDSTSYTKEDEYEARSIVSQIADEELEFGFDDFKVVLFEVKKL